MLPGRAATASRRGAQLAKRGFFDYLAVGGAAPKGDVAAESAKRKGVDWEVIEWYRPVLPDFVQHFDKVKSLVNSVEASAYQEAKPYTQVNFDDWRQKIKDPAFVDELEVEYRAKLDIANSYTDPYQKLSWSEEARKEYHQKVCDKAKEFGIKPPKFEEMASNKEQVEAIGQVEHFIGTELDSEFERQQKELQLDYEQIEAERDMFGVKGEMMDYALHPQIAEQIEETSAGKQSYCDRVLWEYEYSKYTKRERLLQLQGETQRQAFLERWKLAIRMHGTDSATGGSD